MSRFLQNLSGWLRSGISQSLIFVGLILLAWGTLAPVGTLVWWLNQGSKGFEGKRRQTVRISVGDRSTPNKAVINCYIVYLPGVGDASADQLTDGEEWFLDQLVQRHPNCVSVRDVFPYSATNKDLVGERLLSPVWQFVDGADGWLKEADILIKIRNLWRFAISADDRYGPVYGQGIADAIIDRMNVVSPIPSLNLSKNKSDQSTHNPLQVILIGTSGGVQVALSAVPYLDQWLNQPKLSLISVGGDFDGEAGFDSLDQMYHLHGSRDWVEDLSALFFPARWRWTVTSPFNRARQQNRFKAMSSGPQAHDGKEGYFGMEIAKPDHKTYVALTLEAVNRLPLWSDVNSEIPQYSNTQPRITGYK